MALWIACGYLALAVIFYFTLTVTATDVSVAPLPARHRWQRTRKAVNVSLLRRLRSRMAGSKPKHPH